MQTAKALRIPQVAPMGLLGLPIRSNWGVVAPSVRGAVGCHAKKGFGAKPASNRPQDVDDGPSGNRARSRRVRRDVPLPMMSQEEKGKLTGFQTAVELPPSAAEQQEAEEFALRLKALKQEGAEKKKELSPGPLGAAAGNKASTAAFDAAPESIYANPPSIGETLMSQLNSDVSDPKMKNAQFGPSQIAVAGGAILFGLVFVLVAGGDFAPNNRFKGVRSAREAPDSVEQGIIKTRISTLEQDLKINAKNPEAVQALALSYAQLLQYDKAANLLDKLTALQPNSADAWRLLGETSLLGEQASRAVKAYEKAITLRDDDLQIATGLVDSYIANGQQSKAVDYLKELRPRAGYVSALGIVAKDAPPADSTPASDSTEAAPAPDSASASSQPEASSSRPGNAPIKPLEPVSVELLLAKTYSGWRGHDNDALATYDALIERFPEDFRGYLAKGVFLRDKGRRADAERMFLQARFYAPENRQRFVKETAATKPVIELPDQ